MRRILVVAATAVALSIPASVAAIGVVGAGTAGAAGSTIQCKSIKGNAATTVAISKCTPATKAEKKGEKTLSGESTLLEGGGTLTWSNSGTQTTVTLTVTSPGQGNCKKKNTEFDATGSVTADTSAYGMTGDVASARVCVNNNSGAITLVKGTTMAL